MNERTAIGGGGGGGGTPGGARRQRRRRDLERRSPGRPATGARKDRLMQLWCPAEVGRLTNCAAGQNAKAGNPGPEMSIAKLAMAEFNKALYEFCVDLLGADGMVGYDYTFRRPENLSSTASTTASRHAFLRARANSIEGGTSRDHAQHPRRAGARPARRAPRRQGPPLEQGPPQLTVRGIRWSEPSCDAEGVETGV